MTKEEIAGVLERIATLLELKGENPFKTRAYTNAARAIETFGANVSNFQDEGRRHANRAALQNYLGLVKQRSKRSARPSLDAHRT